MTDKQNPDNEQTGQNISPDVAPQPPVADGSRRRFTKSGLAASGVILTLASQPVLGQFACQSPSGFQSGNVSSQGTPPTCLGRTPGYWQAAPHHNDWALAGLIFGTCTPSSGSTGGSGGHGSGTGGGTGGGIGGGTHGSGLGGGTCNTSAEWSGGTLFSAYFDVTGNATIYAGHSMMSVLWMTGSEDPYQLGAHIVAALLNAKMGWTPVLLEQAVKDMFNEWAATGGYVPTAGAAPWSAAQIVAYLQTTMTL